MNLHKMIREAKKSIDLAHIFGLKNINVVDNDLYHWKLTIKPPNGFHKNIMYNIEIKFLVSKNSILNSKNINIKKICIYPYGGLYDKLITPMIRNKTSGGICIQQFKSHRMENFYKKDLTGKGRSGCQSNICVLLGTIIWHLNNIDIMLNEKSDDHISGIKREWREIIKNYSL